MSKAYRNHDKQTEREIKYLRGVFDKIDETIELPRSLHGDILRQKLDGITPDGLRVKKPFDARDFFKSRVLSLQSVVSYALAFVVIAVIAYSMRVSTPDIVDGTIAIQDAVVKSEDPQQVEAFSAPESARQLEPAEQEVVSEDTPLAQSDEPAMPETPVSQSEADSIETAGVGGGGEAYALGEDETYSYVCREIDQTDPDKAGIPLTLEIVDKKSGELILFLDISDMEQIDHFFCSDGFFGIVGTSGSGVLSRAYGMEDPTTARLEASQAGQYLDARLVDGNLHVITLNEDSDFGDVEAIRLPDSTSDASCVITTADIAGGECNQIAYLGVDVDKRLSVQNRNVYIPYDVIGEEEAPELYMAQVKLEGIRQEMILVP